MSLGARGWIYHRPFTQIGLWSIIIKAHLKKMNLSNKKHLHLSRVLFFLCGVFLCTLYQLNTRAKLNEPVQMPQFGEDSGESSTEKLEEARLKTGGLEEHLTTDQTLPITVVPYINTTAASKASNPNKSAETTIIPPKEPPRLSTIPPLTPDPLHNNDEFPADLFSMAERRRGWVILHMIGMMYMFISLAVVCDEFFVPALEVITDKLSISEDVAGATVMAAGRSTPKLLSLLMGVFISPSIVAFGSIVGPAVFNILFVIGACALLSRGVLHVSRWALYRDLSFYTFDLILLIIFFLDNVITWWESLMLVGSYSLYITFMKFNAQIQQAFKTQLCKNKHIITSLAMQEPDKDYYPQEAVPGGESGPGGSGDTERDEDGCDEGINEERAMKGEKGNDRPLSLEWPDTLCKQAVYLFLLPIIVPLWLTLPDVRKQRFRKFFVATFLGSILWIWVFSYLMVWWAHRVGETIGIPEEIMGLTVLAAGTSIPDIVTSVIVARKGLGDMAVSSSVGSNIFNITVGLPVPWLLYSVMYSFAPAAVNSTGLVCGAVLLFIVLLFFIISITSCKWRMNKALGFTMLLLYLSFVVLSLMFGYRFVVCPVSVGTGQ